MRVGYELRYKNGDIVYWCQYQQGECHIHFGMVDTQFSDAICIDLLVPKDCRTVEGVPIKDWTPDNRQRKLPKSWTGDTKLFEYGYIYDISEDDEKFMCDLMNEKEFVITDKEKIMDVFNRGCLVKSKDNCHCIVDTEIGQGTWTLRMKTSKIAGYAPYYGGIDYVSVSPYRVYDTYEEALAEKNEYEAEFKRIQDLSDLEWSIEQIDNTLNRWAGMYDISDKMKKAYREFLMELSNLEDVEVRIFGKEIQWKYWKNSRWRNIEVSDKIWR